MQDRKHKPDFEPKTKKVRPMTTPKDSLNVCTLLLDRIFPQITDSKRLSMTSSSKKPQKV